MKITKIFLAVFMSAILLTGCKKEVISPTSGPAAKPKPILPSLESDAKTKQTVNANNEFAFELFKQVNNTAQDENIMLSPLSVSVALGMAWNGANGATKTAMEQVLKYYGLTPHQINNAYKSLIGYLTSVDPTVTMKIANSIWHRNTFQMLQSFLDTNQLYFNAQISPADFSDPQTVNVINTWVSDNTGGKITKIVDVIKPFDVMFLINAIYYYGQWTTQFNPNDTYDTTFTKADGSTKTVDMMIIPEGDFRYTANQTAKIIELPYGYERFSMVVIKPANNQTLDTLIAGLTPQVWDQWMSSLFASSLRVGLPKFRFNYECALRDVLINMGMGVAFGGGSADFTGISPLGGLFITDVKHKTYIDVNEKGTEAAAVTSVNLGFGLPPAFIADSPFLFVIREKESNAIVFIGKVENPHY